jgi:hypothetical protein
VQNEFRTLLQFPIQYADPMDLTKMLDVMPGTERCQAFATFSLSSIPNDKTCNRRVQPRLKCFQIR